MCNKVDQYMSSKSISQIVNPNHLGFHYIILNTPHKKLFSLAYHLLSVWSKLNQIHNQEKLSANKKIVTHI